MRTSYSAISTYLTCPQKYKFQEINKIKAPKSREAIFGTLIHRTLQFMFKSDPLFPTLDEVIGHFREHWPRREVFDQEAARDPLKRRWTDDDERIYFESGITILKNFYERNAPWNYTVVDLESHFEITLTDEKTGEVHILAGNIDRIDKLPDGGYEIIDYKTTKRMPSQAVVDKDLQLSLYLVGLKHRWPHLKAEDITMSLYFLKHREKLSTKGTEEKAKDATEKILRHINEIQEQIRTEKTFEPIPGPLCNWCSFRPICPAWRHLYKIQKPNTDDQHDMNKTVQQYFLLQKEKKQREQQLKNLQEQIKTYMEHEGVTRVFGEGGYISKKLQQRFAYDLEKIKSILSPLGKWEDILKADETKLKKIMNELPEEIREEIRNARTLAKEFSVLTATNKKIDT